MLKVFRAAAAAALASASAAQAVTIAGVNLPEGPVFGVAQIYENIPTSVGSVLSGYGKIDSINSLAVSSLCSGCELTYVFGGYTVTAITSSEVRFGGGWLKVYLGYGADNDFTTTNPGGAAGDFAEASNGTLFLSLKGHEVDALSNTLIGTGVGIGTTSPSGFSTGLLDVDYASGGIANSAFDTNPLSAAFGPPMADVQIGSSFTALSPLYPADCPGGAACLRGSSNITASVVPEPGTGALLLAGAGIVGLAARRRMRR